MQSDSPNLKHIDVNTEGENEIVAGFIASYGDTLCTSIELRKWIEKRCPAGNAEELNFT